MASVVTEIQALGVEVKHIPSGCTYLCQPVDIGNNKPYKKHLRMRWECWMMAEGLINGTTSPPLRKDIAQWGLYVENEISVETVKKIHGDMESIHGFLMKRMMTAMRDKLCSYKSLEMILLSRSSSLFCSGLPFVVLFTIHFFLGEPVSATSNGPEMIAPMATPLFLYCF